MTKKSTRLDSTNLTFSTIRLKVKIQEKLVVFKLVEALNWGRLIFSILWREFLTKLVECKLVEGTYWGRLIFQDFLSRF